MAQSWRMSRERRERRALPALDEAALDRLAIAYVGRFGTTEAKLAHYLGRKVRERGWEGDIPPRIADVVARCVRLGYVDDAAFAKARGENLTRRGLGARRVAQALHGAGVREEAAAPAREAAKEAAWPAAIAFARRRRIGPFAREAHDQDQIRRDLAAMVRAGHAFALARRIVQLEPGASLPNDAEDDE